MEEREETHLCFHSRNVSYTGAKHIVLNMYNERTYVKPATHSIAQVDLFVLYDRYRTWVTNPRTQTECSQKNANGFYFVIIRDMKINYRFLFSKNSKPVAAKNYVRSVWMGLNSLLFFWAASNNALSSFDVLNLCGSGLKPGLIKVGLKLRQAGRMRSQCWARNATGNETSKALTIWPGPIPELAELEHVRSAAAGSLLLEGSELGGTSRLLPNDLGRSQKIQEAQIVNTRVEPCLFISMSISYLTLNVRSNFGATADNVWLLLLNLANTMSTAEHDRQYARENMWHVKSILLVGRYFTKGSSSGATLSFALRSKGEGGQPRYLIIQESHLYPAHPPLPPPRTLALRADPKHCNLQCFCAGMEKGLLATC